MRILRILVAIMVSVMLLISTALAENLRIAFNYNSAPYHFIGDDYTYIGMHIEMMNWIAKEKGYEVVYMPYDSSGSCLQALRNNEVDIILGHRTGDISASGLLYTDELSTSNLLLVVNADKKEQVESGILGRTSAVTEFGITRSIYMDKLNIQSFVSVGSQRRVFETLQAQKCDLALMISDCFDYYARKEDEKEDYSILLNYVSPVSHAILLREDQAEFCNVLNQALATMRASGKYQEIYRKWIISDPNGLDYELMRRINYTIAGGLALALLVTLAVIAMNRYLSHRVSEKTRELSETNAELDKRMMQLESEYRLRYGIIEDSPSAMISFDKNYGITLFNRAAAAISGVKESGIGSDVRNLPVFGALLAKMKKDIFSMDMDRESARGIMELEDGAQKRSYRYNIYHSGSMDAIGILFTVEDVTREEERARSLFEQEKNATLNQLIAGIAHEIRNPLMAIRTSASLLQTQWEDPEVRGAFIRFVPNEVDRINQLIENLIGYARPAKGEQQPIRLSDIVTECLYLTAIAAKKSNIVCSTQLEDSVWIFANRDRIKQSLINIIINGIESIEKKISEDRNNLPSMSICVKAEGEHAIISIRDEGTGMSSEEIWRCTEPFYTTKSAGTGLGLALVQQFLSKNGGTFSIDSEEGCYTEVKLRFRRYLPNEG